MVIKESLLKDIGRLFVWFPMQWIRIKLQPGKDLFLMKYMGKLYSYCGKSKVVELDKNISSVFDLFEQSLTLNQIIVDNIENHLANQYLTFLFSFIFTIIPLVLPSLLIIKFL